MNQELTKEIVELRSLWLSLGGLGETPPDDQWRLWEAMHTPAVVRKAVLHTAAKRMSLGQKMDLDYQIRFASKVMNTQTEKDARVEAERARILASTE